MHPKNNKLARAGFDSPGPHPYHTRRMPTDWSRPQDIDRLADRGTSFDFDAPLVRFPRLREQLATEDGVARGSIRMFREQGQVTAEVSVSARVPLQCQRCLGIVVWPVESQSRVRIVNVAEDATDGAGQTGFDEDAFFVEEGRIALPDLVEEELLLGLPLIARHPEEQDCVPQASVESAVGPAPGHPATTPSGSLSAGSPVTSSPFAGLSELLKRPR